MLIMLKQGIFTKPFQASPWRVRGSGQQTERADCNYLKNYYFFENSLYKDKSVFKFLMSHIVFCSSNPIVGLFDNLYLALKFLTLSSSSLKHFE